MSMSNTPVQEHSPTANRQLLNVAEYMDQEYKIDIEEGSVNIDYLKKETEEEIRDYEERDQAEQYKSILEVSADGGINNETMSLHEIKVKLEDHTLIDVLVDENMFERKTIQTDEMEWPNNIKIIFDSDLSQDTSIIGNNSYCSECSADYQGFCSKCSILTHLLNNNILRTDTEWIVNTISRDILEVKDTLVKKGIYALKNIPENVILGPFEGVLPIETSDEFMWKIEDEKLSNLQDGNWMQYINCAKSAPTSNLDVFQFKGNLFYRTNKKIDEGEELLVYFKEEDIRKLDNNEDGCFIPTLVKDSQKIFACTFCCLGFKLEGCLIKHKLKCPHAVHNENIPEIIQCYYCNFWLEEDEYLEHHVVFCRQSGSRLCKYPAAINRSKATSASSSSIQILHRHTDNVEKQIHLYKCPECYYQTNLKSYLAKHVLHNHKHNAGMELYQCTECTYKTKHKGNLTRHLGTHNPVMEKLHNCTKCTYKTNNKGSLNKHIKCVHRLEKFHKSSTECIYKTNNKPTLKTHMRHKCPKCSFKTDIKSDLTAHIMTECVGLDNIKNVVNVRLKQIFNRS